MVEFRDGLRITTLYQKVDGEIYRKDLSIRSCNYLSEDRVMTEKMSEISLEKRNPKKDNRKCYYFKMQEDKTVVLERDRKTHEPVLWEIGKTHRLSDFTDEKLSIHKPVYIIVSLTDTSEEIIKITQTLPIEEENIRVKEAKIKRHPLWSKPPSSLLEIEAIL